MDTGIDLSASATPYILCSFCQKVAATYSPDRACIPREELLELYKRTCPSNSTDIHVATKGPDIMTDLELYWATREPLMHNKTCSDLRKSDAEGCHLCALLVYSLNRNESRTDDCTDGQLYVIPADDDAHPELGFASPDLEHLRNGQIHQFWLVLINKVPSNESDGTPLAWVAVTSVPKNPDPVAIIEARKSLAPLASRFRWCRNTGAPEGYQMVASWVRHCLDAHEICKQSLQSHMPTRLLDLFAYPESDKIRLISTHDMETQAYATLSYRWGDCSAVTLRSQNHDAFMAGICVSSLPKTIREAVLICQKLSIRCLWIDALCIQQTNRDDFSHEISRMGSIYAGSLLTIAATDSADCESGCFRERDPLKQEVCYFWENECDTAFFGGRLDCAYDTMRPFTIWQRRETLALDKRAWVFQERMMSPRTVHFGKYDIYWECRYEAFCQQCILKFLPHDISCDNVPRHKEIFTLLLQDWKDSRIGKREKFRKLWNQILLDYSQTELTFIDDRLSALAGIAEIAVGTLGYSASFGLWLEIFMDELMWYIEDEDLTAWPGCRQLSNMPSWSWANTPCQIHSWTRWRFTDDTITDVQKQAQLLRLPPATAFDRVSVLYEKSRVCLPAFKLHGWIVQCQPVPNWVDPEGWRESPWTLISTEGDFPAEYERWLGTIWEVFLCKGPKLPRSAAHQLWSTRVFYRPDSQPQAQGIVTCLLIRRIVFRRKSEPYGYLEDHGLVLERTHPTQNQYRRLGVFVEIVGSWVLEGTARQEVEMIQDAHEIAAIYGKHMTLFSDLSTEMEVEII